MAFGNSTLGLTTNYSTQVNSSHLKKKIKQFLNIIYIFQNQVTADLLQYLGLKWFLTIDNKWKTDYFTMTMNNEQTLLSEKYRNLSSLLQL
jgi:hypothetical protein